jgi:mannosyl-3-phosphoglycerate phosphatase
MKEKLMIIFSDLDGTLLDHYTYESTPAHETLLQLQKAQVPVVLTSSKTFAELSSIQESLDIEAPFIIENGAAVFIPKPTFSQQPTDTIEYEGYWVKSFSEPLNHWINLLSELPTRFDGLYLGFSTLSLNQLMEITGLDETSAKDAKKRQYGEPIHWLGDEASKEEFIACLEQRGATILKGGRFIHVSGSCDKGKALNWLKTCYSVMENVDHVSTIALGDGKNDVEMLDAADVAVQVRSPVHAFPKLTRKTDIIQTSLEGPAGWADAIQALLSESFLTNSLTMEKNHG